MAINQDIVYAILSLDSYNRGYGAGIIVSGTSLGNYSISDSSSILLEEGSDSSIGFYAQVYTLGTEKIISFRGTDNIVQDAAEGWILGGGFTTAPQGMAALDMYEAVVGDGNELTADITLVGHSLGGGLAGYLATLYGQNSNIDAYVYDSMTFNLAAYHDRATDYLACVCANDNQSYEYSEIVA